MQLNRRVTNFVVSCLTTFALGGAKAHAASALKKDVGSPVEFNFKLGGESTLLKGAPVNASTGTSLEYQFFKTYYMGAEYSLYEPYTMFNEYVYNGSNDASVYLGDRKLWQNKAYGLSISGKVSFTLPVSHWSQEASINWATGESLVFKKTFSDREFVSYTLSSNQYSVRYIEAYENPETKEETYNTQYDVNNRLTYSITPIRGWAMMLGGGIRYYVNYNDGAYYIYRLGAATSIDLTKSSSIDFTLVSFKKDQQADKTWSGPANSENFFDAKGTLVSLSLNVKI